MLSTLNIIVWCHIIQYILYFHILKIWFRDGNAAITHVKVLTSSSSWHCEINALWGTLLQCISDITTPTQYNGSLLNPKIDIKILESYRDYEGDVNIRLKWADRDTFCQLSH